MAAKVNFGAPEAGRRLGSAAPRAALRPETAPMGNSVGILTALDPLDRKTLWATQQWSNDAAPCVWATRIVGYRIAPESR